MEQQNSPAVERQRIGQEKSGFPGSRARRHGSLSLAAQLIKVSLVTAPFLLALLLFIFYSPEIQAQTPLSGCDNFTSGYDGWVIDSAEGAATLSNPPGIMRLSADEGASKITVTKTLTGYPGSINITSVFTSFSQTTLYFWVKYADNSTYYLFAQGNTSSITDTHYVNYTTPADKVPVALYFFAAVSSEFSGFKIDIDYVCIPSLPPDQTLASECPLCSNTEKNHEVGRSINTYSGNYHDQTTDLSIANVGQPLRFERSYNSLPVTGTAVYSRPLGYGWTHNYDLNLTLPDDPGGEPGVVILKAPHGSRLRFRENGDGTYSPAPGVWANLVRQGSAAPYTYLITAANQTAYTFGLLTNSVVISPVAVSPPAGLTLTPHYNVAAAPGTILTLTHTLTNTGLTTDTYTMTVASAGNWLAAQPVTATLAGGAAITVTARVTAPQTYGRDAVITASLAATSWTTPTLTATVVETLTLRGYRLLASADPQGNQTQFDYDSSGYLSRVSDPTGQRYLNFSYDGQSRLIAVTDHTNRSVGYGYDANHNLTVVTDTRSLTWTYAYTTAGASPGIPHYLHTITDPDQRLVHKTFFDSEGRATRQVDGLGQTTALITYTSDITRVVTEAGKVMTDAYTSSGLLISQTDAAGTQNFGFDSAFNREQVTDANNQTTRYDRDEFGVTRAITDALTRTTVFTYDTRNNLIAKTDARGTTTSYTYDSQNNLSSMTTVSGTAVYTYNSWGQMTAMTDQNGHTTLYGYNSFGDRTVITDAIGQTTNYGYDGLGRVVTTTDALGKVTVNEYDNAGNLLKVTENYLAGQSQNYQNEYNLVITSTYDGAGRQVTTTDTLGRVERVEYDAAGRLLRTIKNEHPTISTQNYLNQYNLITKFNYDSTGMLVGVTDTLSRETRTEYDDLNRIERIIVNYVNGVYDPNQPDEDLITRYEYDANGNQISTFDILGHESRTEYDELNRIKRTITNYQNGLYDPAQPDEDLITSFTYDVVGNQETVTDPLGRVISYTYDSLNRAVVLTNPLSGTTRSTYDAVGNQLTLTDAENRTTTYQYDALNRVVTATDALNGLVTTVYDGVGNQLSVTDANNHPTRYSYDRLSRRTVITDALNHTTHMEYDAAGRLVKTIDPLGQVTLNEYNDNDNLIRVTKNYLAGQPQNYLDEYNLVTEYAYDPVNQPIVITDTLNRVTRREYDDGSRLVRQIVNYIDGVYNPAQPDEDIITLYAYDGNSNLISTTDALGRETRIEYDDLNRAVRTIVNYIDGTYNPAQPDEDIITRYNYDGAGNQISTIDTLDREIRAEYDALNRVIRSIINYQNGTYNPAQPDEDLITGYTYDRVGNIEVITDTLSRVTTYAYDNLNRVLTITNPLSGTTSYSYDPVGNRLSLTDANNHTTIYGYDSLNRVMTTTDALNGQTLVTYDAAGNRTQISNPKLQITTYQYDSLYRLAEITDAENQTTHYTYDALSNQLSVTDPESNTITFSYDDLNRVIQITNPLSGVTSTSYDALGNRLTTTDANSHTTTYVYDDLNRLIHVTDPNSLTTVTTYDGLGNRLSVTNDANETSEFEYDEVNRLVLMRDNLGHETEYRYDGAGNRVAIIDAEDVETRYGYDALNRLTSIIENYEDGIYSPGQTDQDVQTSYSYDAVGNRTEVTDARNHTTIYDYDDLNRLIKTTDPLSYTTHYAYDAIGNRTVITDANGAMTAFTYDEVNQLTGIDYPSGTADTSFTYDQAGNRKTMSDGTGNTVYTYDNLYRLTEITNGANQTVGYRYDAVGNRTNLIYPNNQVVTYTYDLGNRLEMVTDWHNGQFGYNYDEANRLTGLTLPNDIESSYTYDDAGRLTLLTHNTVTETLASYAYDLDQVGNRTTLTETLVAVLTVPSGAYLENGGLVVMEAEHFGQVITNASHTWLTATAQSGYTGTAYLYVLPDLDVLYQTSELTGSPRLDYSLHVTTPGTYTVWLRGYPTNAAGDSLYLGLDEQIVSVTGFTPGAWNWTNITTNGVTATLPITTSGLYTVSLWMREDGLRVDRLLLTTDTTYVPTGFGPTETERQIDTAGLLTLVDRTITYDYDDLYQLISADYSTGQAYDYSYDPVGNRLQQIIDGDTTTYLYDAANRLTQVGTQGYTQTYTFDDNGNLLNTGVLTNTFDTANRLIETERKGYILEPVYNGVGDQVGQTAGVTTTHFALDVQGLPEVIYTSEGNSYLHLPGVIMAESSTGEVRYLLSDGLGSIRQAVAETGAVVAYNEFDPYGNPVETGSEPYGFTGEWWQEDVGLLYLRARWYLAETGTFVSRDQLLTMSAYPYADNNPINRVDPSGYVAWHTCVGGDVMSCRVQDNDTIWGIARDILYRRSMAAGGVDNLSNLQHSDGYNLNNSAVNATIERVMEPEMWQLNSHLHPAGYSSPPHPTDPSHLGWHCPACQPYNPSLLINLPGSWLQMFLSGEGPQPDETSGGGEPSVPYFPDPIVKPSVPPVLPGGLSEIVQAIYDSHSRSQKEDGIIFGFALAANAAPLAFLSNMPGLLLEANGACLPGTGATRGIEIVYDFKHMERGIFEYHGPTVNIGSVYNLGGVAYIGKTRGFANEPDYSIGVRAYEGPFASVDLSVSPFEVPIVPSPSAGVVVIEAAPLDKYKKLNPTGVFATYVGVGIGGGQSYIPVVNADVAVTNYTILFDGEYPGRLRYVPPGIEWFLGLTESDIIALKKSIPHRATAAMYITLELEALGGLTSPTLPMTTLAVVQLWGFVGDP